MPQSQGMAQVVRSDTLPHPALPQRVRDDVATFPERGRDDVAIVADAGLAREAARLFAERGVTFGVLEDGGIWHRPIPIDPLPRRLAAAEWQSLERGLLQRTLALDAFIQDVYGRHGILRAGRIPAHLVYGSPSYLRGANGPAAQRPGQIAVAGLHLGKVDGRWLVLEDNVPVPSGITHAPAARLATPNLLSPPA